MIISRLTATLAAMALLAGCAASPSPVSDKAGTSPADRLGLDPASDRDPFPSTYRPLPSERTAITGASILTGTGELIETGTVILGDGKILAVGRDIAVPAGTRVIDGRGKWITPGLIDIHSHLGIYPSPSVAAHQDGNEWNSPNTADVWAEHAIWPQDPGFIRALEGGVTTLMVLPGSSNLFGGRTVVLKNVPSATMQGMKFPGAPQGLKMACGENPKRNHGGKGRVPSTRMGNVAGYRKAWIEAAEYRRKWEAYRKNGSGDDGKAAEPPKRDLTLDTLAGVLAGEILVQNHCYKAEEMAVMIDVAKEFGYKIRTFHHASEAYKIADLLAREDICVAVWAQWWGFKMEAYDGIEENAPINHAKGVCTIIHSDDEVLIQHLNQEAAIALSAGRRMGIDIPKEEAIKWITANPAKAMGILDRTGTLEPGKMADLVLWSADPFSVYARAETVFIDGAVLYDRYDPRFQPKTDFELTASMKETGR